MLSQVAGLKISFALARISPLIDGEWKKTFQSIAIGSTLKKYKLQFGLFFWPVSTGRKPVAPSTLLTPLGGTFTLR